MALANNDHRRQALQAFRAGVSFHELHKSRALPVGRTTLYRWYREWRKTLGDPKPQTQSQPQAVA